jgi:hypothetical protein
VRKYLEQFGARKCEANALVVRPEAGRRLCLDAIRRYVSDDELAAIEAVRVEWQDKAEVAIRRLLGTSIDGDEVTP